MSPSFHFTRDGRTTGTSPLGAVVTKILVLAVALIASLHLVPKSEARGRQSTIATAADVVATDVLRPGPPLEARLAPPAQRLPTTAAASTIQRLRLPVRAPIAESVAPAPPFTVPNHPIARHVPRMESGDPPRG